MNIFNKYLLRGSFIFLLCLQSLSAYALPTWYDSNTGFGLNSGVPDFFQHQSDVFSPPFPYADLGYCCSTAFVDSLYYLQDRYSAPELYTQPASGNWLDGMVSNLQSVIKTQNNPDPNDPNFFVTYLNSKPGHKWTVTESANTGVQFDIFDKYMTQLLAEQAVLVFLDPNGLNNWWWGYHVLAGVGIDVQNHGIIFADPDTTMNKIDATHADSGFCNTVAGPCTPTGDYANSDAFPWGGGVGDFNDSYYQQFSVDAQGVIQNGPYKGAKITAIYDISLPEPDTLVLASLGLVAMIFVTRRRLPGIL